MSLAVIGMAALAVLTGCSPSVPATEALADEAPAWDPIPGAEVVREAVVDGSSRGLMGKPGYPTVARHVVPTDGATADELSDHLVAASVEQGWEQTLTSTDLYRATKSLDSGAGHLLIAVHDEFQPARVIVSVSVM